MWTELRKKIFEFTGLFVFLFAAFATVASAAWQEPTQAPPGGNVNPPVWLQPATPGTAQTGNINITGKILAGAGLQVNGQNVCLQDGTNCQASANTLLQVLQNSADASAFSAATVKIAATSILTSGANAGGLVVRSNAADANAQNFAIYINPSSGPEGIYSKGQIQIAVIGDKSGAGNPPLVVQSSKMVDNLNAQYLEGSTKAEIIAAAQTGGGGTTEYYIYQAKSPGLSVASCDSGFHIISFNCTDGKIALLGTTQLGCMSGYSSHIICESDFPRLISAPSNLTATLVSPTRVDLAWTNSTPQGESIKVERKEDTGSYSVIATVAISATSYTDNTVQQGRSYTYRVYIFNTGGANSPYSNEATVGSSLSAPTGLAVSGGTGTSISLTWTDTNTGEDGYKIERQAEGEAGFTEIVTATGNTYTNTGLTTGVQYSYQVRAYRGTNNSSYSNQITTRAGLVDPTNFRSTGKTTSSIDLAWNDNAVAEDGYKLEYWTWDGSDAITGQTVLTLAANSTSRSFTGLEEGRYYGFKVYAYNGAYTSNAKPELVIATVLLPPTGSIITLLSPGSCYGRDWEWPDTISSRVCKSLINVSDQSLVDSFYGAGLYLNNSLIGIYRSNCGPCSGSVPFSEEDFGTSQGPYYYDVGTRRQIGSRIVGSQVLTTPSTSFFSSPTGFTEQAPNNGNGEVRLKWDSVLGSIGYRIHVYNMTLRSDIRYLNNYTTTDTSYTISGLTPNQNHKFILCPFKTDVEGLCSVFDVPNP